MLVGTKGVQTVEGWRWGEEEGEEGLTKIKYA